MSQAGKSLILLRKRREVVAKLTALFATMPEDGSSRTKTYLLRAMCLGLLLFVLLMPLALTLAVLTCWLYSKKVPADGP